MTSQGRDTTLRGAMWVATLVLLHIACFFAVNILTVSWPDIPLGAIIGTLSQDLDKNLPGLAVFVGALLLVAGFGTRRLALAWVGALMLTGFGALFLFGSGIAFMFEGLLFLLALILLHRTEE